MNPHVSNRPIGRLQTLSRYPVKSMAGESISRALIRHAGMVGDRVYAFVSPQAKPTFPWVTIRQVASLVHFVPRFQSPEKLLMRYPSREDYDLTVETPAKTRLAIDSAELFGTIRELFPDHPFSLRFSEGGQQDQRPLSLLSEATRLALEKITGFSLHFRRFRPNLFVKWESEAPFFEDTLLDRELRIGQTLRCKVTQLDKRCRVINVDPVSGAIHPGVLEAVGQLNRGYAGVYLVPLNEGMIEAGSEIHLADS